MPSTEIRKISKYCLAKIAKLSTHEISKSLPGDVSVLFLD